MAAKTVSITDVSAGKLYKWTGVTEADTITAAQVDPGKYTVTVEGTFGGGSWEMKYGKESANIASIDSDNLTFAAAGSYNIEIGRGFVGFTRTGGSSTNLNFYLSPIPR